MSRVLFIAPFPPPVHGSAVVSMQIRDSKVIKEAFDGDYVNLSTSRNMGEIGKDGLLLNTKKLFRFLCSLFKTLWLLLTRNYELCYLAVTCHGAGFLKDAPFVLMCKLFGHKVVIHQHNKGMSKDVDRAVFRRLYPLVYNNVKVILLSWYLYPDIKSVVKRENVMICPNGIKSAAASLGEGKKENRENGYPERVPHILFLSNLLVDKGVLVLLDALEILKNKGYGFICNFVGGETKDIDSARFAQEVEKRGLDKTVIYHGKKFGEDKNQFWKDADMFVFPTYYSNECFPLVLLEAMEKGLPCISTEEGGIRDIIVDGVTGFITKRQDADSLADVLKVMIENPKLRTEMGLAGRKRFEEHFTEEIFEKRVLACLKSFGI